MSYINATIDLNTMEIIGYDLECDCCNQKVDLLVKAEYVDVPDYYIKVCDVCYHRKYYIVEPSVSIS